MRIIDILEAKANLHRLVENAAKGEPFAIAKDGVPLVRVFALNTPQVRRLGFLAGEIAIPADFDQTGAADMERLFGIEDEIAPRYGV